ncbi:PaaI family thioesterase [Halomonas sp. MCCC 1A17488]|uniref:PaaI family thioesterase n=1 Tax=Billgrantia sulfidoxydans TaxID=2733484 RepID=A0ABX7W691_9GAMM|nr:MULTISPECIES: PaaI family thioesterase [Halomonas]MCE8018259.1 PaaI family thioesterase [Halomonas sp. MCCC 1A17488]MCG3241592.1 PaaI family thioesterase [Halomonas sp. MCCC 1A17488]QPP48460.1 PaaI family thioesterase [Halomonas sp. SS10-MC5]QTP55771.1 PaaI family thioesterase [Halomonas sulfidoxydans]
MPEGFHDVAWLARTRARGDVAAWIERLPYARHIGVSVTSDAEGDGLIYHLEPREHNVGNILLPALHGGVVAAFMETAGTLDLMLSAREPRLPRIVDFSIDYLRTARVVPTHARCRLLREGRRLANVQVTAWQASESQPVATARLHLVLGVPEPSDA